MAARTNPLRAARDEIINSLLDTIEMVLDTTKETIFVPIEYRTTTMLEADYGARDKKRTVLSIGAGFFKRDSEGAIGDKLGEVHLLISSKNWNEFVRGLPLKEEKPTAFSELLDPSFQTATIKKLAELRGGLADLRMDISDLEGKKSVEEVPPIIAKIRKLLEDSAMPEMPLDYKTFTISALGTLSREERANVFSNYCKECFETHACCECELVSEEEHNDD